MSYEHGTPHYNLPQTVGTDKRDWFDTNEAFADVDADLYAAKTASETAAHDIETIEASVTALEGRVGTAEGDIDTLEAELATANENIGINSTAIADVRTQLGADKQDLKDAICAIEEASATAEYRHEVGTFFWYNDTLYKTTVLIPVGQQIVPNVNCSTTNITTELLAGGTIENVVRYDAVNQIFEYNDNGTWTPIPAGTVTAGDVSFNDTLAQLGATDVQDAIVALKTLIDNIGGGTMIDFTNVLKEFTSADTFTATTECALVGGVGTNGVSGTCTLSINNKVIAHSSHVGSDGYGWDVGINVILSAGDVVATSGASCLKVYALK